MARMMIYSWNDQDNALDETKMGDHFVPFDCTDKEAEQHTIDYIRTQFPRRARHFNSGRVLHKVWDVSDIAKKFNIINKRLDNIEGDIKIILTYIESKNKKKVDKPIIS